jgi:hypothetical protein
MFGTQVQKVRLTFCPDAVEEDEPPEAAVEDEPPEAAVEDEPPEEQPAATSAATATLAIAAARPRRRGLTSFIDPPQ